MTRVSVVILTWNKLDYTKQAVSSLMPIMHEDDEVIFIDNQSTDGTIKYLNDVELPCYKIVNVVDAPCGIGKAYNKAFDLASGDYIFIYDNDLQIQMPDTLDHMISVFEQKITEGVNPGIVCPCMNNITGRVRALASKDNLPNDIQEIIKRRLRPWPELPSAGWLMSAECMDKVGCWDEQFDPYGIGDYDYAMRVLRAGFRIFADRFIFVHHFGSITSKEYVTKDMLNRTRALFMKKWFPDGKFPPGMYPRV